MLARMEWLRRWRWEALPRTADLGSGAIPVPADPQTAVLRDPASRDGAIPVVVSVGPMWSFVTIRRQP